MIINIEELNQRIKNSHITVEKHPTHDIYIYGYHKNPLERIKNNWNEYSKMCRGLILDSSGRIIERPFSKFWTFRNYLSKDIILQSENRVLKLPDSKPKIFEKLDGTMGILYWIAEEPFIATQRSFSSMKALRGTEIIQKKYRDACKRLDRKYTYVFEIIYPENSLIVDYGSTEDIILIGVIDKETGYSINEIESLGFITKTDLTAKYSHITNINELEALNIPNLEGIVVEYNEGVRLKIKFPWYKKIHSELQKLINAEFQKFESIARLKEYYQYEKFDLTTEEVISAWKRNELEQLYTKFTINQIDDGAFIWAENQIKRYEKEGVVNVQSFQKSLDSLRVPDNRLWNWKERYLKNYYD
ncbi:MULTISPECIES: RNA ligase [unclassified Sphingobacterium]|uniref:RNA ligase n=1 Tax=unclassified Sphingobacterium TaxID=2609468 RepID=UPI0025E1AF9D|nr:MULTISPECIES: RNA ligase [unclassified Sphingobacterium]